MTEQPRLKDGSSGAGQYTFKQQSEAGLALAPAAIGERLAEVDAALAHYDARWEAEKADLAAQSEAHAQRRRRLSGARTASRLLKDFPDAATMTYTRDPLNGITTMESIEDANGYTLFDDSEMDGSGFASSPEEVRRKVAVRQSIRRLTGTTPPPEHTAQGITIQESHGTETIHLPTALEDGYVQMDAEDLTPEQASAQRTDAAMSHWIESQDHLQEAVRDMFTDMRHYAKKHGVDLNDAFWKSQDVFQDETNDPTFKEGF